MSLHISCIDSDKKFVPISDRYSMTADDLCNKDFANDLCSLIRGVKHFWPLGEVIHKHNSILVATKCSRKLQNIYPNAVRRTCHWIGQSGVFGSLPYLKCWTYQTCFALFPDVGPHSRSPVMLPQLSVYLGLCWCPENSSEVILGQPPSSNHLSGHGRGHHLWERTAGPWEQVSLLTCCLLVEC